VICGLLSLLAGFSNWLTLAYFAPRKPIIFEIGEDDEGSSSPQRWLNPFYHQLAYGYQ
jgi:hypothetical protein